MSEMNYVYDCPRPVAMVGAILFVFFKNMTENMNRSH